MLQGRLMVSTSLALTVLLGAPGRAAPPQTRLASVRSNGHPANSDSSSATVSADGRYVAFESDASNLVPGDTNAQGDVFVHDMVTGRTTLASVNSKGAIGNDFSGGPFISGNGRYVAFESNATNLVKGDTNATVDVFVHDMVTGRTTLASVRSNGVHGDDLSEEPTLSANGRYVAFMSTATNLVPSDTNAGFDVFVHDMVSGRTTRVSVRSNGGQADLGSDEPMISGDGRYVVFGSNATNLVGGDSNAVEDIFWHDRVSGKTIRVSVSTTGVEADNQSLEPSVTSDGRFVAFSSIATNLVGAADTNAVQDMFVRDMTAHTTRRVSLSTAGVQGNGDSGEGHISPSGKFVAYGSYASNLVGGDTNAVSDVFIRDFAHGTTRRGSINTKGAQGNDGSYDPAITPDGRFLVFESAASNLVGGDTNAAEDIFERGALAVGPVGGWLASAQHTGA